MRFSSTIVAIIASVFVVSASSVRNNHALISARHSRISVRSPTLPVKSVKRKRCKAQHPEHKNNTSNTKPKESTTTTTKAAATPVPTTKADVSNTIVGLLSVKSNCGNIGATKQTTRTSGPNGSIDWLNCGLTGSGWNPPLIKITDIVSVSLSSAVNSGKGPFLACSKFVHFFEQYGGEFGIPAIMLASFAMQESSCNPDTVGGAGEQGLMQITKDKCGGAPGGNCRDPAFNIRTGAKYFANTLRDNGGDLLAAVGNYNGWEKGMTYAEATAAAKTSCCRCQRNCD
ncbi:hypothetical protein H0H87_011150 [Tephrocybe sp. NHM501043]|nr:hypothetical protein H0H87_011150 [Tephrocybe sp. NHM501043]